MSIQLKRWGTIVVVKDTSKNTAVGKSQQIHPLTKHLARFAGSIIACCMIATAPVMASPIDSASSAVDLTQQFVRTVELRDWDRAAALANAHPLAEMGDVARWLRFRNAREDHAPQELFRFLNSRKDWPGLNKLRRTFEESIADVLSDQDVLRYFAEFPAETRTGQVVWATALFNTGNQQKAVNLVQQIWVEHNFSAEDAKFFAELYGEHLRPQDHQARLDRLLWDRRNTEAARMLRYVSASTEKLAVARIRLQRSARGVDAAINAVPRRLRDDPGLAFDRMHWRRQKGRRAGVLEILANPPQDLGQPHRWWPYQKRAIRDQFDDGRETAARRLASRHRQAAGPSLAEASWLAGWLHLRAGQLNQAEQQFLTFNDVVSTPISKARGAYWLARTYAKAGNVNKRDRWLGQAMLHPTTFYGQAAASMANQPVALDLAAGPTIDLKTQTDRRVAIALAFCDAGARQISEAFITRIGFDEIANGAGGPAIAIELARHCNRPDLAIELGKRLARQGTVPVYYSFPIPTMHDQHFSHELRAWRYAIMRQESHMDPQARSSAGALGLMQLIPGTAERVARSVGRPFGRGLLLSDIHYNAELGTAYFDRLLTQYDGEAALALAAYNAGPSRVNRWLNRYGDPRGRPETVLIDWIESIPFAETRNYVQRVMESQKVYQTILESSQGMQIGLSVFNGPVPANRPFKRPPAVRF